jgi:hypothetical protein
LLWALLFQLQNENAGLITNGLIITKTLLLYKEVKLPKSEKNESRSMTKLCQLDKIIKLCKTYTPGPKADFSAENLYLQPPTEMEK